MPCLAFSSAALADSTTGNQCNMTWNLEYWNARNMPARKEIEALTSRLSDALGGWKKVDSPTW